MFWRPPLSLESFKTDNDSYSFGEKLYNHYRVQDLILKGARLWKEIISTYFVTFKKGLICISIYIIDKLKQDCYNKSCFIIPPPPAPKKKVVYCLPLCVCLSITKRSDPCLSLSFYRRFLKFWRTKTDLDLVEVIHWFNSLHCTQSEISRRNIVTQDVNGDEWQHWMQSFISQLLVSMSN